MAHKGRDETAITIAQSSAPRDSVFNTFCINGIETAAIWSRNDIPQAAMSFLLVNNPSLNICKPIKTPTGFYTPDFESDDCFFEIKSTYTIEESRKSGQMKKIKWVCKNVKKVKVIILDERIVYEFFRVNPIEQFKKSKS